MQEVLKKVYCIQIQMNLYSCLFVFPFLHRHNLLLYLVKKKSNIKEYSVFLEIGSTREEIYGQGSTEIIAKYNRLLRIEEYLGKDARFESK